MKNKTDSIIIDFNNVSTRRGMTQVLHQINFSIHTGESVAIIGPNGSGKSTLIKLISKELYPTEGNIDLFGKEIWDVFELREHLGIVSNDLQETFNRNLPASEVVISGFFNSVGLWDYQNVTAPMREQTLKLFKELEIQHLYDRQINKLSSGEARKLLLARALIRSPQTLLFDEPTNSLDLKAQHEFRHTLKKLIQSKIGVILATHHLADIPPEIERVLILKDGRVFFDGEKNLFFKKEKLKSLFGINLDLIEKDGWYHAF